MKMSILEIEYRNIRKINDLKIPFVKDNGEIIKNNFIMMANGTGKTTTMTLLKGLFDGTAPSWPSEKIKSFAPTMTGAEHGEFAVTVKFDEKRYKYVLFLDYKAGSAEISTITSAVGGRESGRHLPESIRGIFSPEFVRRFIFDGEQAEKTLDSSSNEADETIKYLYRLDELDEIVATNQKILTDIQNTEGNKGSVSSIKNLRTRQSSVNDTITRLKARRDRLRVDIKASEDEKKAKEEQRNNIDRNYEQLNQEKIEIFRDIDQNKGEINASIAEILRLTKSPYLLSPELCSRMQELGNSMTKLKLPKSSSKDFFIELANAPKCVCDRCIGQAEKDAILRNAEKYLGSDQQAVLNTIKSSLMSSEFDTRLSDAFANLAKLREKGNRLDTLLNINQEKLIKAGGEEAELLQTRIKALIELISVSKEQLRTIESKDDSDDQLTTDNNLHKAEQEYQYYEQQIAKATRTNAALRKKIIVEELVREIRNRATSDLKAEIVRKTNEKLKRVITDDFIEIESIDRYIKLNKRDGASEGQTLSIAYCFLGTLFEDSELEFPFVIDSPTGKMDFAKRQAVADIIPHVFNQMVAFVQSAEVERFADRFYANKDSQYITIIASPTGDSVEVHKGIEFFDSYQREHKGDEQ
jgi:hypothetical protein